MTTSTPPISICTLYDTSAASTFDETTGFMFGLSPAVSEIVYVPIHGDRGKGKGLERVGVFKLKCVMGELYFLADILPENWPIPEGATQARLRMPHVTDEPFHRENRERKSEV